MYPNENLDLANPGLSPLERETLRHLRDQTPRGSKGTDADSEAFLRTIPLDADIDEFLSEVGETLLSLSWGAVDSWERDRGTSRLSQLKGAATAVLYADMGVRLMLGERVFIGDTVADPEWLALLGIVPCSVETLATAKSEYARLAGGRDANQAAA
jgi:hypothetical protein